MDEENKDEVKEEGAEAKAAKASKPKAQGGSAVSTGLQFLTLLVMIAMVALQYIQFEKVTDLSKRLNEEGKVSTATEKTSVAISDIELYEVVNGGTYNIKLGDVDKYLVMTVNLGINTKDKAYKTDYTILTAKAEVIKETVEAIVSSTDLSYFDGGDLEYTVKQKIIDTLNEKFDTTIVVDVYFSDKIKA